MKVDKNLFGSKRLLSVLEISINSYLKESSLLKHSSFDVSSIADNSINQSKEERKIFNKSNEKQHNKASPDNQLLIEKANMNEIHNKVIFN